MSNHIEWRMRRALTGALFAAALTISATFASVCAAQTRDPSFLTFSVGYFDILHNEDETGAVGVEWTSSKRLWILQPMVGAMVTGEGGVYGYAGFATDLFFGSRWVLTPSLAAGAYSEGGGLDLGHVVEFRSSLALGYRFDNRSRLGLRFYHLSNAGLGDRNPGVEVLDLTYSLPLR